MSVLANDHSTIPVPRSARCDGSATIQDLFHLGNKREFPGICQACQLWQNCQALNHHVPCFFSLSKQSNLEKKWLCFKLGRPAHNGWFVFGVLQGNLKTRHAHRGSLAPNPCPFESSRNSGAHLRAFSMDCSSAPSACWPSSSQDTNSPLASLPKASKQRWAQQL